MLRVGTRLVSKFIKSLKLPLKSMSEVVTVEIWILFLKILCHGSGSASESKIWPTRVVDLDLFDPYIDMPSRTGSVSLCLRCPYQNDIDPHLWVNVICSNVMSLCRYDLTVPFARYCAMNKIDKIKRYHIAKVISTRQSITLIHSITHSFLGICLKLWVRF